MAEICLLSYRQCLCEHEAVHPILLIASLDILKGRKAAWDFCTIGYIVYDSLTKR